MFCPKCKNDEFIEIFVCESCKTIYDSVKTQKIRKIDQKDRTNNSSSSTNRRVTSLMPKSATQIHLKPSPKAVETRLKSSNTEIKKTETAEIKSQQTSPTLVEFQNRNTDLPAWRLQLKNAVQKRMNETSDNTATISSIGLSNPKTYPTSGGNALKAEVIDDIQPDKIENEQLANALRRIESSRQKYYVVKDVEPVESPLEEKPAKEFPFKIASRNDNPVQTKDSELKSSVNFPNKPKLVPKPKDNAYKNLYDTSELDPNFIPAKVSSSFEKRPVVEREAKIETKPEDAEIITQTEREQLTEIEDVAPFAWRFNAGLFDLIVGSFASLILLSPFVLLGGNWFSTAGLFAFLATCALTMFIYMTTSLGLFGKTFGMHLFALELVDYNSDEYPTFHQSAVNSSIYLLSIAFFGLGFVTIIFDEDRRAVHDLVSKTIVVKEI